MPLPFLPGSAPSRGYALFGKIPSRQDYLRINASHPVCHDLDEGLHGALTELAGMEDWQAHYDRLPVMDLLWTAEGGQAFVGSLIPSRDASGRRYPLVAGLLMEAQDAARYGPQMPVATELMLAQVRHFLQVAVTGAPDAQELRDYLETQAQGRGHDIIDEEVIREIHSRVLATAPWSDLGLGFAPGAPEQALRTALLHLLFQHEPTGQDPAGMRRVCAAFPLDPTPGRATLHAAAWLDLLRRLPAPPGRSWGRHWILRQSRHQPRLLVHAGRPSRRQLAGMLLDDPSPEFQLNLRAGTAGWHHHPMFPEISYRFDRFLESKGRSIVDLIHFLSDTVGRFPTPNP